MHFPDLGTNTQIDEGPHVRAVGWLCAEHPFPIGDVLVEFVDRLRALCQRWGDCPEALWWPVCAGPHECEFCHHYRASGNLGVPSGKVLFVAPEMILHYVEVHRYRPPDEFISAVLACPIPGSAEYAAQVSEFRAYNLERFRRLHGE
jgi:hypothetical protein